jgi:glycerophosphoryl diester phosphodiesterase
MEIIAHRGASAYALENSREALELAIRLGADRIELDVRVTRDNVPIVLHDAYLDRLTTGRGRLVDVKFSQLAKIRLKNGEPILSLVEALAILKGRCPLYIDLKEERAVKSTIKVLHEANFKEVIIGATSSEILKSVQLAAPGVPTSLMVYALGEEGIEIAQKARASFIHLCWERYPNPTSLLTFKLLRRIAAAGLKTILWHEERPEELEKIAQFKDIFGVCTNAPDLARRILVDRDASLS